MTDITQCCQLLMYARFVSGGWLYKEPISPPLILHNWLIFNTYYFQRRYLTNQGVRYEQSVPPTCYLLFGHAWSEVWVHDKGERKNPSTVGTHCILHREVLASRTLPAEMRDVLNVAIKVVNFIKAGALNSRPFTLFCKDMESEHEALLFHTNVRLPLKGNMLGRLYELREDVAIFLDVQHKTDLHDKFMSEGFLLSLAYLVDTFEALNAVNLELQGKNINIIIHHDIILAFLVKLDHWKSRVQNGDKACFSN
ncbi:zinc finger BED domain-containing protein 5-like [Macrobrachium nipponense]|uniref:zinc finger BED domain-containing protein 5-like n=1 Tax=Macrobrachium nipponense TaxID=159736 RepID=UPI0030C82612